MHSFICQRRYIILVIDSVVKCHLYSLSGEGSTLQAACLNPSVQHFTAPLVCRRHDTNRSKHPDLKAFSLGKPRMAESVHKYAMLIVVQCSLYRKARPSVWPHVIVVWSSRVQISVQRPAVLISALCLTWQTPVSA
jgi:hypothetical protein